MRKSIQIENLRGVREGQVRGLQPLSLFVGPNNSGKSTVLEAALLAARPGNAQTVAELATARGWCGVECVRQMQFDPTVRTTIRVRTGSSSLTSAFALTDEWDSDLATTVKSDPRFEQGECLQITARAGKALRSRVLLAEDGETSVMHFDGARVPDAGELVTVGSITRSGTLEDAYSAAAAVGHEQRLEELVHRAGVPGGLLRILKRGEHFVLHLTRAGAPAVAVYFAGDGFKRLVYMACVFAKAAGDLVLLEEPEAYQHPRYRRELAALMWGAVEHGTQLLVSTHSLGLVRLVLEGASDLSRVAVFKTDLDAGVLTATRIPGERALERVDDLEEDLRL